MMVSCTLRWKKNILYQKGLLFISVNWASVLPMIAKIKGVKSKSLNNIACFYSAPARAVLTAGHWTGITEQKQEKAPIRWTSKLACLVITRHERPSTNRFERQLPQSFWGRERGESKKEKGWRTDCRCGHSGVTNGSLSISAIQHCCAIISFGKVYYSAIDQHIFRAPWMYSGCHTGNARKLSNSLFDGLTWLLFSFSPFPQLHPVYARSHII